MHSHLILFLKYGCQSFEESVTKRFSHRNSLFGFSFVVYIYYLFIVFFLEKPYITFLAHYAYTTKLYYA